MRNSTRCSLSGWQPLRMLNTATIWSRNSTLRCDPKKAENRRPHKKCALVWQKHYSWWAKGEKQTVVDYLATKRNKILMQTTTQMNLESIRLSKDSQPEKIMCYWFHLYDISRINKSIETKDECRGREGPEWEMTAVGYRVYFWDDKSILNRFCQWLHNSVNILRTLSLKEFNFKRVSVVA